MADFLKRYGFFGTIRLVYFVIRTKILFKNARLIRFPIDVRGKKYIKVQQGFTTGIGCRIEAYPKGKDSVLISIGKNVQMNDYVHITAMKSVIIGDNVLMASKIYISDCTHGFYNGEEEHTSPDIPPILRPYSMSEVEIGDNVWIGEFVSVLPGVKIGKGAIIGANSVVSKDIPENSIAVGIPARVIKTYNSQTKKWERT